MKASKGNKVVLEYEGTLDNGEVFDSNVGKQPLEFIVGKRQVIEGFEEAIIGMEEGQEKKFRLEPKKAYGATNPDLIKEIPKHLIKADKSQEMVAGMVLMMATPDGHQIPLMIKEVKKDSVVLDMNHPLAGKSLNFKIKIIAIKEAEEDECDCGRDHDCDECKHN